MNNQIWKPKELYKQANSSSADVCGRVLDGVLTAAPLRKFRREVRSANTSALKIALTGTQGEDGLRRLP